MKDTNISLPVLSIGDPECVIDLLASSKIKLIHTQEINSIRVINQSPECKIGEPTVYEVEFTIHLDKNVCSDDEIYICLPASILEILLSNFISPSISIDPSNESKSLNAFNISFKLPTNHTIDGEAFWKDKVHKAVRVIGPKSEFKRIRETKSKEEIKGE